MFWCCEFTKDLFSQKAGVWNVHIKAFYYTNWINTCIYFVNIIVCKAKQCSVVDWSHFLKKNLTNTLYENVHQKVLFGIFYLVFF